MKIRPAAWAVVFVLSALLAFASCSGPKRVVLYTSVSRAYAEPAIQSFEKVTGARVQVRYGTGEDLAARILKEKSAPEADVYWNAGILQTLRLAKAGALESFEAPSAVDLPYAYKDTDHLWTMVGFRARVLLLNDALVSGDGPSSILQLAATQWAGRTGMASPLAGGSLAQAAALYQLVGRDRAMTYYRALAAGGAHFVKHDAGVAERVARGELAAGLVDSDAAAAALKKTPGLSIVLPDSDGLGTLYVPSTVALVKGAPHAAAAKKFVDYLLRPGTDEALVKSGFLAASVRKLPAAMQVSWPTAADQAPLVRADMKAILAQAPTQPKK
jgi:iron(III) transport system substrate-binding protein